MNDEPRRKVSLLLEAMDAAPERKWSTKEVADLLGVPYTSVGTHLRPALRMGQIFRALEDRKFRYARTDLFEKAEQWPPAVPLAEDAITDYEPVSDSAGEVKFDAAVWLNGDLVVYGLTPNDDGSVTITRDQFNQLSRVYSSQVQE